MIHLILIIWIIFNITFFRLIIQILNSILLTFKTPIILILLFQCYQLLFLLWLIKLIPISIPIDISISIMSSISSSKLLRAFGILTTRAYIDVHVHQELLLRSVYITAL